MNDFPVDWLRLREPADRRARNAGLVRSVTRHLGTRGPRAITDLGCGTGATMRALAGHFPPGQRWRLVDRDHRLLAAVEMAAPHDRDVRWDIMEADLQVELEDVIALPADLVTMSALLDLVSMPWLTRLADALARNGRPLYAALNYDGRMMCDPPDAGDAAMLDGFNTHQRTDKGFGSALGPGATAAITSALECRGYSIETAASDWIVGPDQRALQLALVEGWHDAAVEAVPATAEDALRWRGDRRRRIDQGGMTITVGHLDIWAYPS